MATLSLSQHNEGRIHNILDGLIFGYLRRRKYEGTLKALYDESPFLQRNVTQMGHNSMVVNICETLHDRNLEQIIDIYGNYGRLDIPPEMIDLGVRLRDIANEFSSMTSVGTASYSSAQERLYNKKVRNRQTPCAPRRLSANLGGPCLPTRETSAGSLQPHAVSDAPSGSSKRRGRRPEKEAGPSINLEGLNPLIDAANRVMSDRARIQESVEEMMPQIEDIGVENLMEGVEFLQHDDILLNMFYDPSLSMALDIPGTNYFENEDILSGNQQNPVATTHTNGYGSHNLFESTVSHPFPRADSTATHHQPVHSVIEPSPYAEMQPQPVVLSDKNGTSSMTAPPNMSSLFDSSSASEDGDIVEEGTAQSEKALASNNDLMQNKTAKRDKLPLPNSDGISRNAKPSRSLQHASNSPVLPPRLASQVNGSSPRSRGGGSSESPPAPRANPRAVPSVSRPTPPQVPDPVITPSSRTSSTATIHAFETTPEEGELNPSPVKETTSITSVETTTTSTLATESRKKPSFDDVFRDNDRRRLEERDRRPSHHREPDRRREERSTDSRERERERDRRDKERRDKVEKKDDRDKKGELRRKAEEEQRQVQDMLAKSREKESSERMEKRKKGEVERLNKARETMNRAKKRKEEEAEKKREEDKAKEEVKKKEDEQRREEERKREDERRKEEEKKRDERRREEERKKEDEKKRKIEEMKKKAEEEKAKKEADKKRREATRKSYKMDKGAMHNDVSTLDKIEAEMASRKEKKQTEEEEENERPPPLPTINKKGFIAAPLEVLQTSSGIVKEREFEIVGTQPSASVGLHFTKSAKLSGSMKEPSRSSTPNASAVTNKNGIGKRLPLEQQKSSGSKRQKLSPQDIERLVDSIDYN